MLPSTFKREWSEWQMTNDGILSVYNGCHPSFDIWILPFGLFPKASREQNNHP